MTRNCCSIKKAAYMMALSVIFETVRKHPILQPVDGIEPATGCLISF